MLNYNLTKSPNIYDSLEDVKGMLNSGGGVNSGGIGKLVSSLGAIPGPIGLVAGLLGPVLGMFGPEAWASVEKRFLGIYKTEADNMVRRFKRVKTAEDLTDFDRYVEAVKNSYLAAIPSFKSTNSRRAHKFMHDKLGEFQSMMRAKIDKDFGNVFNVSYVTEPLERYKYKNVRGYILRKSKEGTYNVYTLKNPSKGQNNYIPNSGQAAPFNGNLDGTTNTNPQKEDKTNWVIVVVGILIFPIIWGISKLVSKKKK